MAADVSGDENQGQGGRLEIMLSPLNVSEPSTSSGPNTKSQVKRYAWAALILLAVTAVIVVPPVTICAVRGCPPRKSRPNPEVQQLRLVGSLLSTAAEAAAAAGAGAGARTETATQLLDLLPPVLRTLVASQRLTFSDLEIIEAPSAEVLGLVYSQLEKYLGTRVDFLVRDFVLRSPHPLLQSSLASAESTSATATNTTGGIAEIQNSWWFQTINGTGVKLLNGQSSSRQVVVGVLDSGVQVDHVDLAGSLWVNPDEIGDDGRDNDGNGIVDDVYGAAFSTRNCSLLWASTTSKHCGIGPDARIRDTVGHGTKIAGILAALGLTSLGTKSRIATMVLKVTDETSDPWNPPYAYSDVIRAVDYGYGKGARIYSMSFGDDGRLSNRPSNRVFLDAAAGAYRRLFEKYPDSLFVAAAGNEWTDLDSSWRSQGYTYSPCMVQSNASNVICVGATDSRDSLFHIFSGNRDQGTNYGRTTVDMGAPGADILTTSLNNQLERVYGTSFSAPMVAGVAALAVGSASSLESTKPADIKRILTTSGDPIAVTGDSTGLGQPGFASMRRLNAASAVSAALLFADSRRIRVNPANNSGLSLAASTWATQAFEWTTYGPAPASSATSSSGSKLESFGRSVLDSTIRAPFSEAQPSVFLGSQSTSSPKTLLEISCLLRVETPGPYSILVTSFSSETAWKLIVGESQIFPESSDAIAAAELLFPTKGWYAMSLWATRLSAISIRWLPPPSIQAHPPSRAPAAAPAPPWSSPPKSLTPPKQWQFLRFNWILKSTSSTPAASPGIFNPGAEPRPALWQVVWNSTSSAAAGPSAGIPANPESRMRSYFQHQTTVPELWFSSIASEMAPALLLGSIEQTRNSGITGYARGHLRPLTRATAVAFRIQSPGPWILTLDGMDFYRSLDSAIPESIVTPCVRLAPSTRHEVVLFFAGISLNETHEFGLTWAACSSSSSSMPREGFTGLRGNLSADFWWLLPSSPAVRARIRRGIACDAWPASVESGSPDSPPLASSEKPRLSFVYPRDCSNGSLVFGGGTPRTRECRLDTRLGELLTQQQQEEYVWKARCWTYWSRSSFKGGKVATPFPDAAVRIQLAGRTVYEQPGDGTWHLAAPVDPVDSRDFKSTLDVVQLLVIEFVAWGGYWNLVSRMQVFDGISFAGSDLTDLTLTAKNMTLITNSSEMFLPF
jgi:hypothetical protein